jgi:hypothetical protein
MKITWEDESISFAATGGTKLSASDYCGNITVNMGHVEDAPNWNVGLSYAEAAKLRDWLTERIDAQERARLQAEFSRRLNQ